MYILKRFQLLILLFLLIISTDLNAQQKPDTAFHYKKTSIGSDAGTFIQTGLKIYSSPFKFNTKDWIITGSVLSATALAFLADENVRNFWQRNQSNTATDILKVGEIYGNAGFAAALSGTIYLGGKIFKDPELAATGRIMIEGIFYAGLTTTVLKVITGRSRPYADQGPYFFKAFQTSEEHVSFPSGHITMAFVLSGILSNRIDNVYASVVLYSLAATTFVQRMYSDKHWLSDAILGAAIGYFSGKAAIKFDREESIKKFSVIPYYEQRNFGLRVIYPM